MFKLISSVSGFSIILASLFACGPHHSPQPSLTREAIDSINEPSKLPLAGEFLLNPRDLPLSGRTRPVWTGDYWPMASGGTGRRPSAGELSALEKYDIVTDNQGQASAWEAAEAARYGNVAWSGHCNGLAAAGIRTKEPIRSVRYRDVDFSPNDVKALLVEAFQNTGTLVGGRCESDEPDRDVFGRVTALDADCRDLNPATLHLALTNYIGLHGAPVIIDREAGLEVWNYPAVAYAFTQKAISGVEAMQQLRAESQDYLYNSRAQRFMLVELQLTLVNEQSFRYSYILEGDGAGNIIGGEWLGGSKFDHPDFIWLTGTQPNPINPYLNTQIIFEIYQQSHGG